MFVPIIIFTWYVQLCHIIPSVELGFEVPGFGNKIGGGFWLNVLVSHAYFFVDWKVTLAVLLWWWPAILIGNQVWLQHGNEMYFGMSQCLFMGVVNAFSWIT